MFDQTSLFFAAGICATALAATMLNVWLQSRADRFLIGWTLAMVLLGAGVILYASHPVANTGWMTVAFTLKGIGFVAVFVAARDYVGRATPLSAQAALLACALVPVAGPILAGQNGFGIMAFNAVSGLLLAASGVQYLAARREAPGQVGILVALYSLTALSFLLCAGVLAAEGQWVLAARPDNWAEEINAIMCIAGITGVGAISIGLNNARAARRHREEARTDALTGLLNRRALFDVVDKVAPAPGDTVIQFDLDSFKAINDTHGHAIGDEVLRRFAEAVRQHLEPGDLAARLGGEEFVIVRRGKAATPAHVTAERVRATFEDRSRSVADAEFRATASAGIAVAGKENGFEAVFHQADLALYRAKDGGRDRVAMALKSAA